MGDCQICLSRNGIEIKKIPIGSPLRSHLETHFNLQLEVQSIGICQKCWSLLDLWDNFYVKARANLSTISSQPYPCTSHGVRVLEEEVMKLHAALRQENLNNSKNNEVLVKSEPLSPPCHTETAQHTTDSPPTPRITRRRSLALASRDTRIKECSVVLYKNEVENYLAGSSSNSTKSKEQKKSPQNPKCPAPAYQTSPSDIFVRVQDSPRCSPAIGFNQLTCVRCFQSFNATYQLESHLCLFQASPPFQQTSPPSQQINEARTDDNVFKVPKLLIFQCSKCDCYFRSQSQYDWHKRFRH